MIKRHSSITFACLAVLNAAGFSAEYVGPATSPATPTDNLTQIPRNAYEDTPSVGIPYQSLFRDTGAPYINSLRDLGVTPDAQLAESVEANARLDLPDFRGRFPLLQRGFAPEDADLKVGPLYFNLKHVSAAALFSDNIRQTNDNRESDWISIVSIGGQLMAQLTEGFRIAVAGNFVYFPSEGEAGFTGIGAPYSFGISANPSANAQVVWTPVAFGLPITIYDEFTVGLARYSNGAYDGFDLYEDEDFDGTANAGIYTLRAPRSTLAGDNRGRPTRDNIEQTYYSNRVGLSTASRLPGDTLFRLNATHTDIWYEDDRGNLPDSIDSVRISLQSDRESLRFKPFVSYRLLHRDDPDRTSNTVRGGIRGPITDLLTLEAGAGYSWVTNSDSSGFVWRAGLQHRPSPYTRQSLLYTRSTSEFLDEVRESLQYRIHKILGPDITATAYAGFHWFEDIDHLNPDREEFRTGLRLHYIVSPKSSFSLSGQYVAIDYDDGEGGTETWRVRAQYRHRFLDRLTARLIYQYENQTADSRNDEFYENLFYVALTWVFD